MTYKKYIDVTASFDTLGNITPLYITWENGKRFDIDRIIEVRAAASTKAGGAGVRYVCMICGHLRALFLEEDKWFVEAVKDTA